MKTIILTEEQVKKVIGNIINEETPKSKTSSMIKQFNIANSFNSGQFQLNTTEQIDVAINEINQIILQYWMLLMPECLNQRHLHMT